MIVRVLHEGQYEVGEASLAALDDLDRALTEALEKGDEAGYRTALGAMLQKIRGEGRKLETSDLRPSDLTLPDEDFSLEEMRRLLASENGSTEEPAAKISETVRGV